MELSHRLFWVKDFPFMAAVGGNGQLTSWVFGVDNTELNKVSP
jgi:hypothetical protein